MEYLNGIIEHLNEISRKRERFLRVDLVAYFVFIAIQFSVKIRSMHHD